jgi:hypothetical protein
VASIVVLCVADGAADEQLAGRKMRKDSARAKLGCTLPNLRCVVRGRPRNARRRLQRAQHKTEKKQRKNNKEEETKQKKEQKFGNMSYLTSKVNQGYENQA